MTTLDLALLLAALVALLTAADLGLALGLGALAPKALRRGGWRG